MSSSLRLPLLSALLVGTFLCPVAPAGAADVDFQNLKKSLEEQQSVIKQQQKMLDEQFKKLAAQEKEIAKHRARLEALVRKVDSGLTAKTTVAEAKIETKKNPEVLEVAAVEEKASTLAGMRGTGTGAGTPIAAPAKAEKRPEIPVLPDAGGVLTPKGVLMYENSLEYVNTTNNVYTFNGVQVAEVVFVGVTNASTAKRQIVQDSNRFRLGLTNRMEADVRFPFVYRNDTTTETNTTTSTTERTRISGKGLGDIDMGLSYQVNRGQNGWPFLVANMRYKMNNADGPFDVPYNADSVATRLPTGTGFHSLEGSMTLIKVSDPAVLFTNLGFVHNFDTDVNKTFGDTNVLDVSPGDAINLSAGMGFSINPETSFTLGYKHSYVFPTYQHNRKVSDGTLSTSESDSASVGALLVGASYRFSPITSLNLNVEVGTTREAPDVRVGVRVPIRLGTLF
jgi:hypothetical protein